jgi:hypothetical protein
VWATLFVPDCRLPTNSMFTRRQWRLRSRKCPKVVERLVLVTTRRFSPLWSVEDIGGSFVVKASNDRPLVFIYYREANGRRSLAKLLTRNAAPRIAVNIAKLPEPLRR